MEEEYFERSESEEYAAEEPGFEEEYEYADVFGDRERAQAGSSYKSSSDTIINETRMFASELAINQQAVDKIVGMVAGWPNHQNYNPQIMVYAALYAIFSRSDSLDKKAYDSFLAKLPSFAEKNSEVMIMLSSGKVRHADVIRYILFFVYGQGMRGVDSKPF